MMEDSLDLSYKELADYIQAKEGQCALILGPELSVDENGIGYRSCFRKMAADNKNEIFSYFEEENLFAFNDETSLKKTRRYVKEFYNNSGDTVLLTMIARIKFPLIINMCPDLSLNKIYEERNIPFVSGYFSKDSKPKFKDLPIPSKGLPVIYNIFGSIDADTSLILNHGKLYETIQFLLPDNSLPENIETFLNQASGFILLGLKFDSWYYQLICHKLKLREYNKSKTNLSASNFTKYDSVSVAMRKQFEIEFTLDNPMQSIERLIKECNNSKEALRDLEITDSYSMYVSYAWKDSDALGGVTRETMVDWTEKFSALNESKSLLFFRDHNDLKFGDSIDSFMTRIGKGKIVLRVISDKYLRSRYCMTEAIRMEKYKDTDQRIVTVIWEDTELENEIKYRNYWREKCRDILDDLAEKLDNNNYDHSVAIYRFLPDFINSLKDEITFRIREQDFIIDDVTHEIQISKARTEEFDSFIKAIIAKIKHNQ